MPEPRLLYHAERPEDQDVHPLRGLITYGPFSRSLMGNIPDPIRLAIVAPSGCKGVVEGLIKELECRHKPRERLQYLIEFPGVSRLFGVRVVTADNGAQIELPAGLDAELAVAKHPHLLLADVLTRAMQALEQCRTRFDVAVLYLPMKWQMCFYGAMGEDFDLHDYLKAVSAVRALPIQIIREDKAIAYPCRCSVMWRLSLALYCKAGGVPWKLASTQVQEDVAYIGLSYAIRHTHTAAARFVTCCSQVFDADGAGLEFLLYETDDVRFERDNPFLSRTEMRRLIARSIMLYAHRHAGRTPSRLVVHKSTCFTPDEVNGCFDVWRSSGTLDLLHVQDNVAWRGVKIDKPRDAGEKKGIPANYPCERGTMVHLGDRDVLLWTQGNASGVVGGNFFKEGKGIPSPLLIRRHAGHGDFDETCAAILGLTKMNWNNDALYDRLPVTIGYAHVLARTVKRMSELARHPYELRFFM